jgi:hypothetical protein
LDGHVEAAGDAGAFERLGDTVFFAEGHEARHFDFGDLDFLAAQISELDVGNFVGQ